MTRNCDRCGIRREFKQRPQRPNLCGDCQYVEPTWPNVKPERQRV